MYSNDLIIKILDYIDKNIDRQISIDELSKRFFYNRYYIMKLFKKELNITIFDYINKIKIYNCLYDIKYKNDFFTKISLNHGFISLDYFSRLFKKVMKVSPLQYKKYIKKESNKYEHDIILTQLIELNTLINRIKKYRENIKPQELKVKTLFTFKNNTQ